MRGIPFALRCARRVAGCVSSCIVNARRWTGLDLSSVRTNERRSLSRTGEPDRGKWPGWSDPMVTADATTKAVSARHPGAYVRWGRLPQSIVIMPRLGMSYRLLRCFTTGQDFINLCSNCWSNWSGIASATDKAIATSSRKLVKLPDYYEQYKTI